MNGTNVFEDTGWKTLIGNTPGPTDDGGTNGLTYRRYGKIVEVRFAFGSVFNVGAFTTTTRNIATLPIGFRPSYGFHVTAHVPGQNVVGQVTVRPDGLMLGSIYSGSNVYLRCHFCFIAA